MRPQSNAPALDLGSDGAIGFNSRDLPELELQQEAALETELYVKLAITVQVEFCSDSTGRRPSHIDIPRDPAEDGAEAVGGHLEAAADALGGGVLRPGWVD